MESLFFDNLVRFASHFHLIKCKMKTVFKISVIKVIIDIANQAIHTVIQTAHHRPLSRSMNEISQKRFLKRDCKKLPCKVCF